jgi:aspartyl-tRNA(Asn)/glutamyl-tRNA(Gln) amidotransferase subunit C
MLSEEEVRYIAKLARLGISQEESKKFQKELSAILDYFNLLEEIDVSKTEPTFHPAENLLDRKISASRKDIVEVKDDDLANKLVEAIPEKENRYVQVKNILTNDNDK